MLLDEGGMRSRMTWGSRDPSNHLTAQARIGVHKLHEASHKSPELSPPSFNYSFDGCIR